ncbi:hypothetical protein KJQ93_20595, partial [Mycobacterium tuberculosis subsp. tuberculosis]|nr:hypothetical protein [Mycobacterium tuberculosis subsp. tuberculosis]
MASIALLAAALSGCGAGQISQTANQKPAVNGDGLATGRKARRSCGTPGPATRIDPTAFVAPTATLI